MYPDQQLLARARILRQQGRFADAEEPLRTALAEQPDLHEALAELALCQANQAGKRREARATIERAIALEPDQGTYHAIQALILCRLRKGKEALAAAERAQALDPGDPFSHAAAAEALMCLERWREAEEMARRALTLDADDPHAGDVLAQALRLQGRRDEAEAVAVEQLRQDPESPQAQCSAGWTALQSGDRTRAEFHFREALRLDADLEPARDGLLQAFRARSPLYRLYLRYGFFMQRFNRQIRLLLVVGLMVGAGLGRRLLQDHSPLLGGLLLGSYLLLVLGVWLAPAAGNLLVSLDRSARHALRRNERIEGLLVGGGAALGATLLVTGLAVAMMPLILTGGTLLAASVPASLCFTNESERGRRVFGVLSALVLACGLTAAGLQALAPPDSAESLTPGAGQLCLAALILSVASTWLGNMASLREAAD